MGRHRLDSDMCNIKRNSSFFTDFSALPGGCGQRKQQYKEKVWAEKLCKNWFWGEGFVKSNVQYKEKHTP